MGEPRVSVVIPTRGRPNLVPQAVRTALDQSLRDLEVVVVIDGHDNETLEILAAIEDPRLRTLVLNKHVGGAEARNRGVQVARAPWIALLDDDDFWFPNKLELQLEAARTARVKSPIVVCRFLARNEAAEFLWPRQQPRHDQPICEYLFCRRLPSTGDGAIQTSTVLAPAELFRRCPLDPELSRFIDIDWLLRATRSEDVEIVFIQDRAPHSVWRMDDRARISNTSDWRADVDWIRARKDLVSRRAYGAFLLTLPSLQAARQGDRSAFRALLGEAIWHGRPGWAEIVFHVGNFALPGPLRRWLARMTA